MDCIGQDKTGRRIEPTKTAKEKEAEAAELENRTRGTRKTEQSSRTEKEPMEGAAQSEHGRVEREE